MIPVLADLAVIAAGIAVGCALLLWALDQARLLAARDARRDQG